MLAGTGVNLGWPSAIKLELVFVSGPRIRLDRGPVQLRTATAACRSRASTLPLGAAQVLACIVCVCGAVGIVAIRGIVGSVVVVGVVEIS
jgi:hypothetical protein